MNGTKVDGRTSPEHDKIRRTDSSGVAPPFTRVSFIVTFTAIKALTIRIIKHKGKNLLQGSLLFFASIGTHCCYFDTYCYCFSVFITSINVFMNKIRNGNITMYTKINQQRRCLILS